MEENNSQQVQVNSTPAAPVPEKQTNGLAIAGFILSLIGGTILTIVGLILSIVGISKAKETNSGRGLAIAGVVIAVIKALLVVICIFAVSAIMNTDAFKQGYCDEIKEENTINELCTKNADGTYDCVLVTCDFDNAD